MVVSEVVAQLQEGALEEGFGEGRRQPVVVVVGGHQIVAVGLIGRVQTLCGLLEPQSGGIERHALAVAFAVASARTECDAASTRVELAVHLQHSAQVLAVAVAYRVALLRVDHDALTAHLFQFAVIERTL